MLNHLIFQLLLLFSQIKPPKYQPNALKCPSRLCFYPGYWKCSASVGVSKPNSHRWRSLWHTARICYTLKCLTEAAFFLCLSLVCTVCQWNRRKASKLTVPHFCFWELIRDASTQKELYEKTHCHLWPSLSHLPTNACCKSPSLLGLPLSQAGLFSSCHHFWLVFRRINFKWMYSFVLMPWTK